jgi:hypothetical protein
VWRNVWKLAAMPSFWLPRKDETLVQVRLYGKKALTIYHQDYGVNGAGSQDGPVQSVPSLRSF